MLGTRYGPVGTGFSILGTRVGSLKHLKKNSLNFEKTTASESWWAKKQNRRYYIDWKDGQLHIYSCCIRRL